MGTALTRLESVRSRLDRLLNDAARLADATRTAEWQQRLHGHELRLAVMGQFKRGKSTLLNALVGADLVPTAVLPLTSVPTFVRHGEAGAVVHTRQGERRIDISELADYVTEAGNPHNQKGVLDVNVTYPSPFLKDGITVVDTPGIASTYEHNTATARDALPQVDVALFVTGIDPPLTAPERAFLEEIRRHAAAVFVILNKVDRFAADEIEEARRFLERELAPFFAEGVRVFALSARRARQGQDPGFRQLLEALDRFLAEEREAVHLRRVIKGLTNVLEEVRFERALAEKLQREQSSARQRKREEAARHLGRAEQEREVAAVVFRDRIRKLIQELDERTASFRTELTQSTIGALQQAAREKAALASATLSRELDQLSTAELQARLRAYATEMEAWLNERFQAEVAEAEESLRALMARVSQNLAELYGVRPPRWEASTQMAEGHRLYYSFEEPPTFFPRLEAVKLAPLLPKAMGHRLVLEKACRQVESLADMNAGRVRWHLVERVQETARKKEREWLLNLEAFVQRMTAILDRPASENSDGRAQLGEVERLIEAADGLLGELERGAGTGLQAVRRT